MTLKEIMLALEYWASQYPDYPDMCSVQINSDGNCILRLGCTHSEFMTAEEFTGWCQEHL